MPDVALRLSMASSDQELHKVAPREQVGAQTGALYEYQYHQAAAEALTLVDNEHATCIYCEWHDDYVTESAAPCGYSFHQVKTRTKSQGPWTLSVFFGLGKKKKGNAPRQVTNESSIFAHLWDHTQKFGNRCSRFIFVTDAGIEREFDAFLDATKSVSSPAELSSESAGTFNTLRQSLDPVFPNVTDSSLFTFLSRLHVQNGVGSVHDLPETKLLIANRILTASEVDLLVSEAKKIGADLVGAVRERSHRTLKILPTTSAELRLSKGLVIGDILNLLSLSVEGYEQLRKGGRESVRALSRLHRLCKRNGVDDSLIPDLCRYKTGWTGWWLNERDRLNGTDFIALKSECVEILKLHSMGNLPFDKLVEQAKGLADKYRGTLTSSNPLSPELVLGLIIELAVQAEG